MKSPRRRLRIFYLVTYLLIAASAVSRLLRGQEHGAWLILDVICATVLAAECVGLAWMLLRSHDIEMRFSDSGIERTGRRGWTVTWEDIQSLELSNQGTYTRLAVVEAPAARARRQQPWYTRSLATSTNSLSGSVPNSDLAIIRAICEQHGATTRPEPWLS